MVVALLSSLKPGYNAPNSVVGQFDFFLALRRLYVGGELRKRFTDGLFGTSN
jgi:hypothetical protein